MVSQCSLLVLPGGQETIRQLRVLLPFPFPLQTQAHLP